MTEKLATVEVSRDENGLYTVTISFADGTHREVTSAEWKTLLAALDFAGKLIAGELSRRAAVAVVP